ncbi:acyltransferase [Methanoplanus endosymbiosus]|uniref:Acyltransferase n=1 Tax=Methanoplanus endosymbiosus TaxID=33865 RepID=A0A9E7PL98_9EURY|nr:acyltransferase [Methanoplanus endosymbiosus]UUX92239.1 acyltransferase [Methanoplanus endosymbiosus]
MVPETIKKIYHKILFAIKCYKSNRYTTSVKKTCNSYGKSLKVNGYSIVTKNTYLGNNVNFNGMKIYGIGNVYIGNYFHSGMGCIMITDNHNYNHGSAIPYDHTKIKKDIIINDNVWLGMNVTILSGVNIGEGAIIQAGSVVVSNIPKYGIAGGHPAKVFKYRDIDHYERLKYENKFH